jgi:hypothetical protein
MAGTGPGDLQDLLLDLLSASVEALDTIPDYEALLEGSPERAFVSPGVPAFDCCPQLTVHGVGVLDAATSPAGLQSGKRCAGRKPLVAMAVTITRCIPVMNSDGVWPLPADMEEAAAQLNADAWALWNHLFNLWCADQLFTFCNGVFWDGLRSIAPQGGCGGWVLNLRVALDGYEEAVTSS